ncbi:MAG: hypothetical protein ABEJ94_01110 [Halorientalis sp.]
MNRDFMRGLIVEESFAYGFTIAFWGTGLLLINEFSLLHTVGILKYAVGTVTGFGLLAVTTFGGAVDTVENQSTPQYHILAGIHYLAALVPIGAAHLIVAAPLGTGLTLFLTGSVVSVGYNISAAVEELVSELLWRIEQ